MNYPASWSEFEDEEGSFLFYNPICWTGNFRISAYRGNTSDFGMESLKREVKENGAGTQIQNLNGIPCVYRKEPLVENGGRYTVHYWLAGMEDVVFECTFTAFENAPIDEALDTISSLELRKENKHYKAELIPVRVLEIFEIDEAFYRVTEMVKKTLSIDFQGQENDLDHLQLMLEQAPLNLKKRNVWTMEASCCVPFWPTKRTDGNGGHSSTGNARHPSWCVWQTMPVSTLQNCFGSK